MTTLLLVDSAALFAEIGFDVVAFFEILMKAIL